MARVHVTTFGEALDLICLREYGAQAGAVERVLVVNPRVAHIAHALPAGTEIVLPDIDLSVSGSQPKLWD
ncbi:tail protein X [Pararhodobacter sp. CCB-MM2]|uniref:tail protein X n=1 Tax=Pararhodobacter sp. CCB-MM2 TaxID=1786003 RepID=UPI000834EB01|nr:tail protein X [Pararhodobacter sp. CCB-MM2]